MLIHLSVQHLAVVESLELRFEPGMTVFTGETGAGKSILMEALGLALGERADPQMIRAGCKEAEITALYNLDHLPLVQDWLQAQDLANPEPEEASCLIRRIISLSGPSKALVNGHMVTLAQLRALAERLTLIHGQHQHQTLLKTEHQRFLLDEFANHPALLAAVATAQAHYQALLHEYQASQQAEEQQHKIALLQYQLEEIDALHLKDAEYAALEKNRQALTHAQSWIESTEKLLHQMQNDQHTEAYDQKDLLSTLYQAIQAIEALKASNPSLQSCQQLFKDAHIHLEEGLNQLHHFRSGLVCDPAALAQVEARLTAIDKIAGKHRIPGEALLDYRAARATELEALQATATQQAALKDRLQEALQTYQKAAQALSHSRQAAAQQLMPLVLKTLATLALPEAQFHIQMTQLDLAYQAEMQPPNAEPNTTCNPAVHGIDQIEFQISLNPGLPMQALRKVGSGGELSRISLAIQLITAGKMNTPTLVFDEVDTGISGKTAAMVGALLRQLGQETQVLCVSHLAQVASQAHHHYRIFKEQQATHTLTRVAYLDPAARTQEIARILGGTTISASALEHARAMLEGI